MRPPYSMTLKTTPGSNLGPREHSWELQPEISKKALSSASIDRYP